MQPIAGSDAQFETARAHPSEEHFLPLHVALGAAAKSAKSERVHEGMIGGALAMDAYLFA